MIINLEWGVKQSSTIQSSLLIFTPFILSLFPVYFLRTEHFRNEFHFRFVIAKNLHEIIPKTKRIGRWLSECLAAGTECRNFILYVMSKILVSILITLNGSTLGILLKDSINSTSTWQCLEPKHQNENLLEVAESVFHCAKKNLYLDLIKNADSESVDIGDGITFLKQSNDCPTPRDVLPLGEEQATLRGLMDAYSSFLSQRSLRWDLGYFYPGLVLRIGPTLNGAGILEFALDRRLDYHERAKLGPGQMIVRRTILPHLLGFRMNLSHLLPLVFGIIIFITKNAFIFSKVTLVLSALLTLKSLVLLQIFRQPQHQEQQHPHHPHPVANDPVDFMDTISITAGNRPRPQGYSVSESTTDGLLLQMINSFPPYRGVNDKHLPKRSNFGGRNFSWEKK